MHVSPFPFRPPAELISTIGDQRHAFFFDSGAHPGNGRARYAYLGCDPYHTVTNFDALRTALKAHKQTRCVRSPVPFTGGAVGVMNYEAGHLFERLPTPRTNAPHLFFGLYDVIAAFDLFEETAWIIANANGPQAPDVRAGWLAELLNTPARAPAAPAKLTWQAEETATSYQNKVSRIQDYIVAGDIYQANLTTGFSAERPADYHPLGHYLALRVDNNPPFGGYLDMGIAGTLLCMSPERFVKLDHTGHISTRPIKGTRPRGGSMAADQALAAELQASPKDRAENLMITDLLRNDLSRVCVRGSVRTPALVTLESFAHVHHLVSEVTGQLAPGLGPLDLLAASFPGGSITGAPKIRAMEIIHELEPTDRGPYCGTLCWIGHDGAMDSAIIIRSLLATDQNLRVQAGGGIVFDSNPAAEYAEMRLKAASLLGDALS